MPQVKINEIDQSRYLSVSNRAPLIALAPVVSSFGPTTDAVLVPDETTYNSIFGPQLPKPVGDITRNYNITLINSGVTLLAKRITPVILKNTGTEEDPQWEIDTSYNVNDITASASYVVNQINSTTFTAKYFGSRGNNLAVKIDKQVFNNGALSPQATTTIYMIRTYRVNSVGSLEQSGSLYVGTFDDSLKDYVGVDNIALSTNPIDDNFIGNTSFLNTELTDINLSIGFDGVPTEADYISLLDALYDITKNNKAIVLTGGADYFVTSKYPTETEKVVVDEAFVTGTTTTLANKPIKAGTFTASIVGTDEDTPYTYTVSEGTAAGDVVTLVCADVTGFEGTLNRTTGAITMTGIPATATAVTMNYTYIETTYTDFTPDEVKTEFENGIAFSTYSDLYPKTGSEFWEAFTDPYIYDFDVIVSSGFTNLPATDTGFTLSKLHRNMLNLAITRGDAVALIDTPQTWSYDTVYNYTYNIGGIESRYSFGAVHAPWCKMRDLSTGNYAMFPASLAFLGAVASGLLANGESSLWYAPAGVARASCPNVASTQYEVGGTILNYWQNTQVARVNPIMKILAYGYCVYGNATLMQNAQGFTKSSLQSLGTRFLCNAIKKAIFSICVALTFEPNDYILWSKFKVQLGDVLRQYQLNGVIAQYDIVMDESTVTNEDKQNLRVPGKVNIVPTLPAEYFDIDFTISAQGVTFSEQVIEEE